MHWIAITPPDRFRHLVVVANVAPNLPRQVGHRREDAARQQVAFDLRKPELHLVEPRRIGRREVEMDVRMVQQERAHRLRLMGREIVGDHVNLAPLRLAGHEVAEKFDKGRTGVAGHGLTRGRRPISCRAPRGATASRGGSTRIRGAPRAPATAAGSGSSRSSAWIAVFSSTAKTAAWSGGFTYSPITSAAFVSKSGSSDCMYRSKRCGCSPARRHALPTRLW